MGLENKAFHMLTGTQLLLLVRLNGEELNTYSMSAANSQILCVLTLLSILKEGKKILSAIKQGDSPSNLSDKTHAGKAMHSTEKKKKKHVLTPSVSHIFLTQANINQSLHSMCNSHHLHVEHINDSL